jgi:hypothetical protein
MPGAPQINWQEFLETYNRIKKASFESPQAMIAALYAREGTLEKVGEIMGVSGNSINLFMEKHGLPRLLRGHRGNSAFQIAFRKIKNPDQYTHRKLAEMLGCSCGYITNLKKTCGNKGRKAK